MIFAKRTTLRSKQRVVKQERGIIQHNVSTNLGNSGSPILIFDSTQREYYAVGIHTNGSKIVNIGVKITYKLVNRIKSWIQDFLKGNQRDEQIFLYKKTCYQIVPVKGIEKLSITPDTNTFAWRHGFYIQHKQNKNICIFQSKNNSDCLCSFDLPSKGKFVFTIKVLNIQKGQWNIQKNQQKYYSPLGIGVMESKMKGKQWNDTWKHRVFLELPLQTIFRPNDEQKNFQQIRCECQTLLSTISNIIECHVNRQSNTIAQHYNGKQQAQSSMPRYWSDGRNLCAIARVWWIGDQLEFM